MSVQENKRIAHLYHQFDPDDMEDILAPNFVGYHSNGSTWDLQSHKTFWSSDGTRMKDTIHVQVAEGDWVATRFTRAGTYQGKQFELEMMSFKRFQDGKIVENWEQYDSKLVER